MMNFVRLRPYSCRNALICTKVRPVRWVSTSRVCGYPSHGHDSMKQNQSSEEQREQQLFEKNQDALEDMETSEQGEPKASKNERPHMEKLKKMGDDARIEQNRPDDGVY